MLPALTFLSADARRHVHAYGDHEHHEHQHGPAAHDHRHDEGPPEGVHVDECEPGQHVLHVTVLCCQSVQNDAANVDRPLTPVIEIGPLTSVSIDVTDVRVHGPPAFAHLPLRAPPLVSA